MNTNTSESINLKEQNNNNNIYKPSISSSSSETISYKWKEDNSSYNLSSQSLTTDKYNKTTLPNVGKKNNFLLGNEYNMRSGIQEKRYISNNSKKKPILLINRDLASHIINENNLLLKKIKTLHNYSYNACYNTNQSQLLNTQNNNCSISISSINLNRNGSSSISRNITYNINKYNGGSIYNNGSSTSSTDIIFPPIQTKSKKKSYR
ncbi:hypothetical protein BCR36DRAFT_349246 [Piromyces finnis]|uniref:Uncharacterized protein n=1 Tax=Piromyces finnis TaxID=1754191 RepID=A0A1Y1VDG3_9FUNG|nr:hypothetical protein BCR36DRAFT_349246 [Piromyces finnis]|eukprot:ORX53372.1 hypothetical protein BCR36DRAFT_349246 [Piromyces finnis]